MSKPTPIEVFSHWNHMVQDLSVSAQEFFSSVEQAVSSRKVEGTKLSRVDIKEGGVLSAKREYLQVKRKDRIFYICCAPFANGFFVSWWMGENRGGFLNWLRTFPLVAVFIPFLYKKETFYSVDTTAIFQNLIHDAVLEVLDGMTESKGIRAIGDLDRKPIMRDLFKSRIS